MLANAYLGLIIFILFLEFQRKKILKPDFLTLFHIVFVLLYPLPAFFLEANIQHSTDELSMPGREYVSSIQTVIAIYLGYFSVLFGFFSRSAEKFGIKVNIESTNEKIVNYYAFVLLIISIISIHIYGMQFGGVINALTNATLIRSNLLDSGPLVLFKHFMPLCFMSSYLFSYPLMLGSKDCKKIYSFIGLSLSFAASFVSTSMTAGRAQFIYYLLVFCFVHTLKTKKLLSFPLLLISGFSLIFILFGKQLFWSLSGLTDGLEGVLITFSESTYNDPSTNSNFYKILANFAYPVHSLNAAFSSNYDVRLFADWLYGIISFLPERIINVEVPNTVSYYNTEFIAGTNDFEIPVAFLAFGIYSMSWPGLIIVGCLYGWIGRYLEIIIVKHLFKINWMAFLYPLIAIIWIDFQPSGDPRVFLTSNFSLLLSICILLFVINKTSIN